MDYITCEKRKNAPQINVLVCEKKCKHANACSTYLSYAKIKSLTMSLSECPSPVDEILVIKESPGPNPPYAAGK